jgi:CBS domain-containing protein
MEKVTQILSRKERHFHTVTPASTISDALAKMNCEHVDYLVVMDEESRFLGVLSEHDIASRLPGQQKPLHETAVKELMNCQLPMATTDDTVENCMRLMRQFQIRYVPVFKDLAFMGVVTSDDILEEALTSRMGIFDTPAEQSSAYFA